MKWFHWVFIVFVILLLVVVVTMQVKANIAVWHSDIPFYLKWKLIFWR